MIEFTVYWDDIAIGESRSGGAFGFTAESIKRFAAEFDPRPVHLDEAAASDTFFSGLAASGAQTFAAWARLWWELTPGWATQAGTRMSDMRLHRPVRAGDVLSLAFTVTGKRPHPRRPRMGLLEIAHQLFNQRGETVLRLDFTVMIERRDTASSGAPLR
jgi:acyl dehydratase